MVRNTFEESFLLHTTSSDPLLPIYLFLLSSNKKKTPFLYFWIFQGELHLPVYK